MVESGRRCGNGLRAGIVMRYNAKSARAEIEWALSEAIGKSKRIIDSMGSKEIRREISGMAKLIERMFAFL